MTSRVLSLSLNHHCMNNVILQLILNYSYSGLHFPLHSGQVLKVIAFPLLSLILKPSLIRPNGA